MFSFICITISLFVVQQLELPTFVAAAVEVGSGIGLERSGCYHNGTIFADGSLVPSMEPCLSCKCSEKTLICSLRVCPEMPVPPPRGCVLVQKKNGCCPYLSCSRYHLPYDGPNRRIIAVLDQYERESIDRVVSENVLQRRSDDSDDGSGEICVHNGTVYKSGSAMSSSSLCTYCFCIGGTQKCVKPKCMMKMEGCKPIFVDSACCPVRYDCSTKTSGVVKSQNHIQRSGNKHYQRMAARLQRSRGCVQNSNFYPEGHKMPSDEDKPCDICFCIRGSKKCTPKKCAPALKNCIPVVPKGQCCPSSYECGPVYEISRAIQSQARQFDLFSMIFGSETSDKVTTTDNPPVTVMSGGDQTTEKSFFDKIREGLEFIDNNESVVGDLIGMQTSKQENVTEIPTTVPPSTTTTVRPEEDDEDFSLFDLLLGNVNQNPDKTVPSTILPSTETTVKTIEAVSFGDMTLGDILLGPQDKTIEPPVEKDSQSTTSTTTHPSDDAPLENDHSTVVLSTTEKLDEEATSSTLQSTSTDATSEATDSSEADTDFEETKNDLEVQPTTTSKSEEAIDVPLEHEEAHDSTIGIHVETTSKQDVTEDVGTSTVPSTYETTTPDTESSTPHIKSEKVIDQQSESSINDASSNLGKVPQNLPLTANEDKKITKLVTTERVPEEKPQNDFLSVLITGLSNIFSENDNETTHVQKNKTIIENVPITRTDVAVEKLNITEVSPKVEVTPMGQMIQIPVSTVLSASPSKPTKVSISRVTPPIPIPIPRITQSPLKKPVKIKTNPTNVEADFDFDYNEPTLPPSLPNLKIIPFLPADAVKTDRKQIFDYYKPTSPQYPSITEKHDNWNVAPTPKAPTLKAEYVVYDHTVHPVLPESHVRPTAYPQKYIPFQQTSQKKYVYNDYEYDEFAVPDKLNLHGIRKNDKFVGDIKYVPTKYNPGNKNYVPNDRQYVTPGFEKFATIFPEKNQYPVSYTTENYDFDVNVNRFSPPTKTEGGFVPKDPIKEHFYYDNLFTTKFLPDLTTNTPTVKQNVTSIVIEITTPDPFKDVIRTEPPPDLHSLIEDKEKLIANGVAPGLYVPVLDQSHSDFEKDIISITTDSSYNYSSEYQDAHEFRFNTTGYDNSTRISPDVHVVPSSGGAVYNTPVQISHPSQIPGEHLDPSVLGEDSSDKFDFGAGLESVLDFLLQDEVQPNTTVPPFKNLPTSNGSTSFTVVEHTDTDLTGVPYQTELKATTLPSNHEELGVLRDILLTTFDPPESDRYKISIETTTPTIQTTTIRHIPEQINHFFSEPFNQLPFLNPSFNVKAPQGFSPNENHHYSSLASDLDLIIPIKNEQKRPEGYQIYPDLTTSVTSVSPTNGDITTLEHHHSEGNGAQVITRPVTATSIQDPAGILKLAGCNIYGRMYRVGRIISELSGPCLECKCTDIGVNCTPLKC